MNETVKANKRQVFNRMIDRITKSIIGLAFIYFGASSFSDLKLDGPVNHRLAVVSDIFTVIGAGFIVAAFWPKRATSSVAVNSPWLTRSDWAAGLTRNNLAADLKFLWLFGLFWSGMTTAVFVSKWTELQAEPSSAKFLLLMFPVAGLGILGYAIHVTRQWWRFRDSTFEMTGQAGMIGGVLEGQVHLAQFVRAPGGFKVRLSCQRRTGEGFSTIWKSEKTIPSHETVDRIHILFAIPPGSQPTDVESSTYSISWLLEVISKSKLTHYHGKFEVPVFSLASSVNQAEAVKRAEAEECKERMDYRLPKHSPVRIQTIDGGGREFNFPAGRNHRAAMILTLILPLWTGLGWLAIDFKAPPPITITFGLIEVIMIYGMIELWFRKERVVIESGQILIASDLLFYRRRRTVAVNEIDQIVAVRVGNSNDHSIKIVKTDGCNMTAVTRIKSRREAEWLADEMAKAAGLVSGSKENT